MVCFPTGLVIYCIITIGLIFIALSLLGILLLCQLCIVGYYLYKKVKEHMLLKAQYDKIVTAPINREMADEVGL